MNNANYPAATTVNRTHAREIEKSAFREAIRTSWPTMPGIFAWGMVTGMAMAKVGLTLWQALGMTLLVFAGSAQLAALPLIASGVPVFMVFVTAMIVNLRFVIFGAAVGPHFAHLPWRKRLLYGYVNGDVTMAFFPRRFPDETLSQPLGKVGFYTGITYSNWVCWQAGSITGILLASQIPENWGLGFAGTLALLAITIPSIVNRAALVGVIVSGIVAVAGIGLPYRLGLLLAVILGMAAAMTAERLIDGANRNRRAA
jgi:predicted branched-subunit amino acid permease